jgi:hypothetical protein
MPAADHSADELVPCYRTIDQPSQLLGLSTGAWATALVCFAAGYGWVTISPLPFRANLSLAVILLGAPLILVMLREQTALSPGRVLAAVLRWRSRPTLLGPPAVDAKIGGGVRLDAPAVIEPADGETDLDWLEYGGSEDE